MIKKLALFVALAASTATPAEAATLSDLKKVQHKVNSSVDFVPETEGRDNWRIPKMNGAGDCEDLALLKRNLLIEAGWPEDDLVLILVYKKTTSLKTKVVQAHIALHVPSQDVVLDASPEGAKDIPQPVQKYSDFMEFNQYKLYCNIADVSTASKARSAGERCAKKKIDE